MAMMTQPPVTPAWASTAVGGLLSGPRRDAFVLASTHAAAYVAVPEHGATPVMLALLSQQAVRLPFGLCAAGPLPGAGTTVRVGHGRRDRGPRLASGAVVGPAAASGCPGPAPLRAAAAHRRARRTSLGVWPPAARGARHRGRAGGGRPRACGGHDRAAAAEAPDAGASGTPAPRTVASALRRGGTLALVSVPGRHAFVEVMDAVRSGVSVMIFSDNVPLDQEILLKDEAARRGVLVMGPDAGTAMVGGLGLGFANALRPGPVGMVAASGTGAQQVSCLLDAAGVGVTAILGAGGRDLSAAVAGRSALAAMELLDAHQGTEPVVVLSKPPDPAVAENLRARAVKLRTQALVAFTGRGQADLTAVTCDIIAAVGADPVPPTEWPAQYHRMPRAGYLRGLFSGGTLCDEAMVIAAEQLGAIASNIPLEPEWALGDDLRSAGHLMVDFGDDRLTRGRPHPMIDHSLRIERIAAEAEDRACAVLLLDVVLGYGAHPDPAHSLAPAIARARDRAGADGRDLAVVVSLIGSAGDPQGLDATARALAAAGASVHLSNAAAARTAVALAGGAGQ